ncbi:hypothetical protein CTAYLR_006589 [Chrysophaeum taylorii]|uniref:SAYSvFN domain-containing protein n=1 Tax=Chrysophaeum taylorii TaxID=2483200 RepID=A0AAD7XR44_9STRA|nr:hypothetical protein CTAYLR_006589 [Chrysophaeum taylorii]
MVVSSRSSPRRRGVALACMVGIQVAAIRYDLAVPAFIVLSIVALVLFGTREKWDGEASAYSVCNNGRRLPGQFTAEQFDAQLRGIPPPDDAMMLGRPETKAARKPVAVASEEEREARRRLRAAAAEQRSKTTTTTPPKL